MEMFSVTIQYSYTELQNVNVRMYLIALLQEVEKSNPSLAKSLYTFPQKLKSWIFEQHSELLF